MNSTIVLLLALVGILAGAYSVVKSDVQAAGAGVILVGLAVLLPLIIK
jgi:hypothetical protein